MKRKMFSGSEPFIFNRARELRGQQTFTEEILWNFLKTKPCGFKFRRQHPYSNYILDFYCHSLKLVIEVDGSIHRVEAVKLNDEIRQKQLELEGLIFMRFSNEEIKLTPEIAIQKIEAFLKENGEMKKVSST